MVYRALPYLSHFFKTESDLQFGCQDAHHVGSMQEWIGQPGQGDAFPSEANSTTPSMSSSCAHPMSKSAPYGVPSVESPSPFRKPPKTVLKKRLQDVKAFRLRISNDFNCPFSRTRLLSSSDESETSVGTVASFRLAVFDLEINQCFTEKLKLFHRFLKGAQWHRIGLT